MMLKFWIQSESDKFNFEVYLVLLKFLLEYTSASPLHSGKNTD